MFFVKPCIELCPKIFAQLKFNPWNTWPDSVGLFAGQR